LPTSTLTPVADGPEPTLRDVLLAIHGLDVRVDSLELKIDGLSTRMDGFEIRMDRFEGRMDRMEERMTHLDNRMTHLDGRMDHLKTSVDVLATRVTGLEAASGKMDQRITDLMVFEATNLKWLTDRDFEVREYLSKRHDEVNRHLTDTDIHLPRQRSADLPGLGGSPLKS
jgi:predicted nuclease with TOPRIM domain